MLKHENTTKNAAPEPTNMQSKPAEQNHVKLYDPIGMTPLSLPGRLHSFVTAKILQDL